jgi:hypothetical protein
MRVNHYLVALLVTEGSEHTLNLFVSKNAETVPWERALAGAQVGSKCRPLLLHVCLMVCVK